MITHALVALAWGLFTSWCAGPVLRALPEPLNDPDAATKPPYASLPTTGFRIALATAVTLASGVALTSTPPSSWMGWLWLAGCGGFAVAVDAATTWLPRPLTWALQAGVALSLLVQACATANPALLLTAGLGAAATRAFFFLFALPSNGIGFGDVELMTAVGALVGAHSWAVAWWALLLGTALGALWGATRAILGRRGVFAFGPALWTGPFLALGVQALS